MNVGNLLARSFLDQHKTEREGVAALHKALGLNNRVMPVSYDFAKLCAKLSSGRALTDQQQIADHLSFAEASIKELHLNPSARLNPEVRDAMLAADYLVIAPGHFFTSVLPHLYVEGFASAWRKSKGKKIWFVNLLAHRGQDSYYTLRDYLAWFEKKLARRPFDTVVINSAVDQKILDLIKDRFEKTKIGKEDLDYVRRKKIEVIVADLVSSHLRPQQVNDTILRAPLRHDPEKVGRFFRKIIRAQKTHA